MTENDWRDAPTSPTGREKTDFNWAEYRQRLASRLLALCCGPFYLLLCAIGWSAAALVSQEDSLFLTGVSALVIMVVITLLAERFYIYRRTGVRFSLSTVFMMTIPFCIYLAAIQKVLQRIPAGADPVTWVILGVIAIGWMGLTTVILMWLAEALMYLAVWWQRWWLVPFQSGSRPSEGSIVGESQSTSGETADALTAKPMIRDDFRMGGGDATSPFKPTE